MVARRAPGANVSVSAMAVKSSDLRAVPLDVSKSTLTVWALAASRLATNSAVDPSVAVASATDRLGGSSSSRIVAVAVASAKAAPIALVNSTEKVSSISSTLSSTRGTGIVRVLTPAANVSVPIAWV